VVIEKNAIFRDQLSPAIALGLDSLRTMIGIGAMPGLSTLRVLDFGGGGGYHHSIARMVLGAERAVRWNVVETSALAKAGGEKLSGNGLKFFDNVQDAAADLGHVDLVFTSSALQYTPDPMSFLQKLLAVNADHLFITRTPLNDEADQVVSVQTSWLASNGPGPMPSGFNNYKIKYPITFANRRKLVELIEQKYSIRFFINEDRFSPVVEGRSFNMYGYFCDLKQ